MATWGSSKFDFLYIGERHEWQHNSHSRFIHLLTKQRLHLSFNLQCKGDSCNNYPNECNTSESNLKNRFQNDTTTVVPLNGPLIDWLTTDRCVPYLSRGTQSSHCRGNNQYGDDEQQDGRCQHEQFSISLTKQKEKHIILHCMLWIWSFRQLYFQWKMIMDYMEKIKIAIILEYNFIAKHTIVKHFLPNVYNQGGREGTQIVH